MILFSVIFEFFFHFHFSNKLPRVTLRMSLYSIIMMYDAVVERVAVTCQRNRKIEKKKI